LFGGGDDMKLSLDLRTTLTQTLTPQQIQYLKLLQLPVMQLEQQVIQEIEQNPMLEEAYEGEPIIAENTEPFSDDSELYEQPIEHIREEIIPGFDEYEHDTHKEYISDQADPFEFHKMLYADDTDLSKRSKGNIYDDEDSEIFQIKDTTSLTDELINQLHLLPLSQEEIILGEQIIGNIDTDGYLRRELFEIVEETNLLLVEINYDIKQQLIQEKYQLKNGEIIYNPARQFTLSQESSSMLHRLFSKDTEILNTLKSQGKEVPQYQFEDERIPQLKEVTIEIAEKVLKEIRQLDPPGIGSRNIQECLIAQCKAFPKPNAAQKLALEILTNEYEPFAKKHYHIITKHLEVTDDYLKEALDVIKTLNPKPGGGDFHPEMNSVIPDFIVEIEEDTEELIITVNDGRIPSIRLSKAYENLKKEAQYKLSNKETREWIRNKYEDAKFLIQAIRQRKSTMLKVMTAIAQLQRDFFIFGAASLKPLIYKNVSETTGLDISTVCRIVNGKYVQTRFGTFELKFFFSESLPNDDGEEISTRVIKDIIKEICESETKDRPYSDDKISRVLKDRGYNVARRTVAKYREQLKIPVARLRKEL
jgi:RNA polymerase sigma-54 factor